MKDTIFIGGLCAIIVIVGALLYFMEPEHEIVRQGPVEFLSLATGGNAIDITTRSNYRIKSHEELDQLWTLIHENERPPLPQVDFNRYEVLAVFDGSHTTGGYSVTVREVVDSELTRMVHIQHRSPDESCMVTSALTSPYELVLLPKMREELRLTHNDSEVTVPCR